MRKLEGFGQLAAMRYNLGDRSNWPFSFVMGLNGSWNRIVSLDEHCRLIYEWHPKVRVSLHDSNVAIALFAMDSACECLVFALNALGQAYKVDQFRDVSDESALRKISLRDVFSFGNSQPLPGWTNIYPNFQRHFATHNELLSIIIDNHDVTKHRQQGFAGGTVRNDPPPGFYESLGIPEGDPRRHEVQPMKEVLLPRKPKLPFEQQGKDLSDWIGLETVAADFRRFLTQAVEIAIVDAERNVKLNVDGFREPHLAARYGRPHKLIL